jgi:Cytochrome c7 and related cytochrome c
MAALFPPWTNAVYRAAIVAIAVGAAAAIAAPMIFVRTSYASGEGDAVEQPVEFDHRHHVRDDGIDCIYCHQTVETQAAAGMPATATCMGCHDQIWPDSPRLAAVRRSWLARTPLRWRRVNAVPDHVYFHHGVHIHAGVACARCHGAIEDMPRVARHASLTMDFCLDCHRAMSGGRAITRITTCTACHR